MSLGNEYGDDKSPLSQFDSILGDLAEVAAILNKPTGLNDSVAKLDLEIERERKRIKAERLGKRVNSDIIQSGNRLRKAVG